MRDHPRANGPTVAWGFVLVLLAAFQPSSVPAPEFRHLGLADYNRFLLCAKQVWNRPVLRSNAVGWRKPQVGWPDMGIPCPASRDAIVSELNRRGYSVFEQDDFVYLTPTRMLTYTVAGPKEVPVDWKRLALRTEVRPWRTGFTSRPLTEAEQREIAGAIFTHARPVPETDPIKASTGTDVGVLERSLWIDVHRFHGRWRIRSSGCSETPSTLGGRHA